MTTPKRPRVLDVTLRDGGFRNEFDFGEKVSAWVVEGLDHVGVDYIEFSLRLPEPKGLNVNGENGFLKKIRAVAPRAKLAVMCVPGLTTVADVREIKECGIDLIRVVFGYEEETGPGLLLVKEAKKLGMEAAVNISYALRWERSAMEKLSLDAAATGADMLYIADSCGSMTPHEVKDRIALVKKAGPKHIGFHGHDNIGMALLNSITAMEAGADFIDASLRGMGNSSGNLKTEIFLVYLNKMGGTDYDLVKLLELTDQFEKHVPEAKPVHTAQQIMLGCFDLHEKAEYLSAIDKIAAEQKISWFNALVAYHKGLTCQKE